MAAENQPIRKMTDSEYRIILPWLQRKAELESELNTVTETLSSLLAMAHGALDTTVAFNPETREIYRHPTTHQRVTTMLAGPPGGVEDEEPPEENIDA